MDLVTVWRIEDPALRYGPYTSSGFDVSYALLEAHNDDEHPAPREDDRLGTIRSYERCGFATLRELSLWFDGWLEELEADGFVVTEYAVPHSCVRFGETQLLFRYEAGSVVKNHRPTKVCKFVSA